MGKLTRVLGLLDDGWHGRPIQPDAVSAKGVHYSGQPGLTALDPQYAGTGSAGAEKRRFGMGAYAKTNPDPLARRMYFYEQAGKNLPEPEQAVGGRNAYAQTFRNLYDLDNDPRGFLDVRDEYGRSADSDPALLEELIMRAGYDGFRSAPGAGMNAPVISLFGLEGPIPVSPAAGAIPTSKPKAAKPSKAAPAPKKAKAKKPAPVEDDAPDDPDAWWDKYQRGLL